MRDKSRLGTAFPQARRDTIRKGAMYMTKEKLFALTAIAAGLLVWGPASAIQYYNVTQVDAAGASNTTLDTSLINGAIFTSNNATLSSKVGTGVFDPFVRIQHLGSANCGNNDSCIEQGYNTNGDGTKPELNTKDREGSNWNHSLRLADIGTETIGGVVYRTFVLDINERLGGSKGDEYLSLDQFRLFVSNDGTLDDYSFGPDNVQDTYNPGMTGGASGNALYNPLNDTLGGAASTRIFDMDQLLGGSCQTPAAGTDAGVAGIGQAPNPGVAGVCDRTVGINYALNSGSGNGIDLVVRVPDTLFFLNGARPEFVYLFSSFGELGNNSPESQKVAQSLPTGDFGASAGFEEWSTLKKTPIAPTLALLIGGLAAMGGVRRLRPAPRFA